MGLFGKKEDPEDLMYQAMTFLEKSQPKSAIPFVLPTTQNILKNGKSMLKGNLMKWDE